MKSRESALRLKRFEAQAKDRKVRGLEQMIRDFEVMAVDLDRQVQAEEDRTGIKDAGHFNYSTFAKAARQRRDKLRASIEDLKVQLEAAVRERDEFSSGELQGDLEQSIVQERSFSRGRRRVERHAAAMQGDSKNHSLMGLTLGANQILSGSHQLGGDGHDENAVGRAVRDRGSARAQGATVQAAIFAWYFDSRDVGRSQ